MTMSGLKFKLQNNKHSANLVNLVGKKADQFSDCILLVNQPSGGDICQPIHAHKWILSGASKYFEKIIKSAQEVAGPSCSKLVIVFNNISYKYFNLIINYIYKGEVMIEKDEIDELGSVAKILGISALYNMHLKWKNSSTNKIIQAKDSSSSSSSSDSEDTTSVKRTKRKASDQSDHQAKKPSQKAKKATEIFIDDSSSSTTSSDTNVPSTSNPQITANQELSIDNYERAKKLLENLKELAAPTTTEERLSIKNLVNEFIEKMRDPSIKPIDLINNAHPNQLTELKVEHQSPIPTSSVPEPIPVRREVRRSSHKPIEYVRPESIRHPPRIPPPPRMGFDNRYEVFDHSYANSFANQRNERRRCTGLPGPPRNMRRYPSNR